jgi:uncharacterized repeat protein (TIGR01451 family)
VLIRLYNLLFIAGIFCLIMAGSAFLTTPTSSSAMPMLALTATAPPPPTAEPTDPPPTATPRPPTATPPPTATARPDDPPTATPGDPTATPRPHRDRPKDPTATPDPSTATPAPEPTVAVSLHKTVDQDTRTPGQTAVYTLVGRNTGAATAYDVVITDDVPAAVEVIDLSSSKGDVVVRGQTVTAYVSVLAPGESVMVKITVRVRANAATGAVVNTGIITTSTKDDPGDNTSSATFMIPAISTVQRLPRTTETDLPGLFSLPAWLPWLLVGMLLVALGMALRLRGATASRTALAAPMGAPAAAMAPRDERAPAAPVAPAWQHDVPLAPGLSAPPAPRVSLPEARPPEPLPPIVELDRPGALRWVKRNTKE